MVKQRAEYFQKLLNDHPIAFFCRVNAVSLVQGGRGGHPFKKKRDQREIVLLGQGRIDRLEAHGVFLPIVRGQFHSSQDDGHTGLPQPLDDLAKIAFRLIEAEPAEPVISAQLEDDQLRLAVENPGDTTKTAGRGVAADTGVDHPIAIIEGIQPPLELGGVRFICTHPESGSKAVTKGDNARSGVWCRRRSCHQRRRAEENTKDRQENVVNALKSSHDAMQIHSVPFLRTV